ncbi:hypothetical protein TNCV_3933681 [Trichonephila clavipes]|nr:hypothetical protein TNCV_3933681 [Trichonephila clavipes]
MLWCKLCGFTKEIHVETMGRKYGDPMEVHELLRYNFCGYTHGREIHQESTNCRISIKPMREKKMSPRRNYIST